MTFEKKYLKAGPSQIAYVTNDLDRAKDIFGTTFGIPRFFTMERVELQNQQCQMQSVPMVINVAIAWTGTQAKQALWNGAIANSPNAIAEFRTAEIETSGTGILFRGDVPKGGAGLFFPVTLLDNPPADAAYVQRENFRPLRAVIKYDDIDEAVRQANGTPYGLGASVWGKDASRLLSVARRLEAGTVWINQHLNMHPNVSLNGRKNSEIGIEFGMEGLKEFCRIQMFAEVQ